MAYDPVELRRRIAVCFSGPELRSLAESLGVSGSIAWERGTQEAVRDLVRQFERYYGLPTLVEKLRELRPLVEWPEAQPVESIGLPLDGGLPPLSSPGALGPPPLSSPGAMSAPPQWSPGALGPPPLSSPGALGAPSSAAAPRSEAPVLRDPLVPSDRGALGAFAQAPPPSRAAPVWPGVTGPPAQPGRTKVLDARVLLSLIALAVLAAVIAFAAGRASTPPEAQEAAQSEAPKSAPTTPEKRLDGPATRAAAALSRTLTAIGRACEVPPGAANTSEILLRAHEQCGPAPPRPRPVITSRPDTPPPPSATPAAPNDAAERARGPRGSDAAPADLPRVAGGGCIRGCDATHNTCKARCGSEPTSRIKYDGYQRCLSGCLATQSRCRLGCK